MTSLYCSMTAPTRENILAAYQQLVASSEPGDALFCHYSGHGAKVRDDDRGEENDGYDETLVPVDYMEAGMIRDDDLCDALVTPLPEGVHLVCVMDCCHSGTVLDLPYVFKADGNFESMEIDERFDFDKFFGKFRGKARGFVKGKVEGLVRGFFKNDE
jgi:metacaspase-1